MCIGGVSLLTSNKLFHSSLYWLKVLLGDHERNFACAVPEINKPGMVLKHCLDVGTHMQACKQKKRYKYVSTPHRLRKSVTFNIQEK